MGKLLSTTDYYLSTQLEESLHTEKPKKTTRP